MYKSLKDVLKDWKNKNHKRYQGGIDFLKYVGPGLMCTVGFIDPGNWATNLAAGAQFGYVLLWVITLSTVMLIMLQHNAAHLGIVTGKCLSESVSAYMPKAVAHPVLWSAVAASVSTSLAEILGGAIALQMLFGLPLTVGSVLVTLASFYMLFSNSYRKVERYIIAFVSVIGLAFMYELFFVKVDWPQAGLHWVAPELPHGSLFIVMGVLGAVVMPHNLFLHSEVIQSRQINTKGEAEIEKSMKYEFYDTLLAMTVGWAINSAIIILAAATFFEHGIHVGGLEQAADMLKPLLGNVATVVFALALLLAGLSSTITSGMAAGSIFAGIFNEPYNIRDIHSKAGILISFLVALGIIFCIDNAFEGLLWSQYILSLQLPLTIFSLVYLTSSQRVMGKHKNFRSTKIMLYAIGALVTALNIMLLFVG